MDPRLSGQTRKFLKFFFCLSIPKRDLDTKKKGYRMVSLNFKVLAKFGLCSNCSQKLDECSLARARKIFATARMLGFSSKFPHGKTHWETLRKNAHVTKVSGNTHWSSFCWRLIETGTSNNSSRKTPAPAKVESHLELWWHVEYYQYYSTFRACQRCTASIG